MQDSTDDQPTVRSLPARVGITALNLIAPGLGLFRLGHWRAGVVFLLVPFALIVLITFGIGHIPITSYGHALVALAAVLGLAVAVYAVPMVLTWLRSRLLLPAPRWSRWYGLAAIAIVDMALVQLASPLMHKFYKPFYAPSESMAPTIGKGDKFMAYMRWRGPVKRGGIVIFRGPDNLRSSRIVAISGDRIAMRGGVPIVNGKAAVQIPAGQVVFAGFDGRQSAAVLTERLPGEELEHRVLDTGPAPYDDMQDVVVPPGHFFVLGDNRDRSADSRIPAELEGVGMVPLSAILGRPMYIHWSGDRGRIGTRLDR